MQTVLVVDDCKDTCDLFSIILMAKGYTVLLAHSLQQALEIAYTRKIDALLTDLCLGDGLGSELLSLMGKRLPKSLILITGRDSYPARRFSGFHDYLLKPVEPDLLCKTVKNCLALQEG